ncbi:hypothetical protein HanRHA438_Chr02g0048791 [Helianthus annuus]|nr:hypothetical protein HanRHA438_Chr02g0048791 [Helianthus annuus]
MMVLAKLKGNHARSHLVLVSSRVRRAEDHHLAWLQVVCVFRVPDCSLQTSARPENHHLVSRNVCMLLPFFPDVKYTYVMF